MRVAWVVVIAACHAPAPAPTTISNHAPVAAGGLMVITERGFGPLDSHTPATLPALRALEGAEIQRVIWSPTPFRGDAEATPDATP